MIITEEIPSTGTRTLAQRLAEGRLPRADALLYATQLADALRKLHDAGIAHGMVVPSNLALVPGGLELLPAPEEGAPEITPYTAPEVVQGNPADARSDVFSFGAILFEMLTGRRAFPGEGSAAMDCRLSDAAAPGSGSPALDRLAGACLHRNPAARIPRRQKILLALKLSSVTSRRAGAASAALQRDTVAESGLASAAIKQLEARLDRGFLALEARLSQIECTVEEMRAHTGRFERNMSADLTDIEHGLKRQSAAIDSARTAMAQTDDLVERVVDALESMQALDEGEDVLRDNLVVN